MRQKVPTILFLMQTKLFVYEMEPIKTELGYLSMLAVSSEGRKGGLALLWAAVVVGCCGGCQHTNLFSKPHRC